MIPSSLPQRIRLGRQEQRLSISRAASLAGVHRATWTAWEQGHAIPSSASHDPIEQVLSWEPGTVDAILAGKLYYRDPLTGVEYTDPDERALWDLRDDLGRRYRAAYGDDRARELGADRARELIAYLRARTAMDPPNPRPAQVA